MKMITLKYYLNSLTVRKLKNTIFKSIKPFQTKRRLRLVLVWSTVFALTSHTLIIAFSYHSNSDIFLFKTKTFF